MRRTAHFTICALLGGVLLLAGAPAPAHAQGEAIDVKVERTKPMKDKHPTMRFLRENKDFIRARFDLLKQKTLDEAAAAIPMDPRFLNYPEMLAAIHSAEDSVNATDDARRRMTLLASISELGSLEERLDLMDRLLAEQRGRLGVLQANFTGDQRTALMVLVRGYPGAAAIQSIAVRLEDGATIRVPISDAEREALRNGGVLEVFHGFVEPREQAVAISLAGDTWPGDDTGYVTLDPSRDRLTLLQLDLAPVDTNGAPSIRASAWLHDTRIPASGG